MTIYKVKFRTAYSDYVESRAILECGGELYIQAENIKQAYDLAYRQLENFCGDKIMIIFIVPAEGNN